MNLTSPSQVKAWCLENGFHPNKVLGQNFLIDKNALDAIIDAAEIPADAVPPLRVLEIGPGLGVLTEGLLARGCAVTAIEKDPVLAARLAGSLGSPAALNVVEGDALDSIRAGGCDAFPFMVSNLPYQAGTRILLELIKRVDPQGAPERRPPDVMVVLVQTEVAERLSAGPGSKTRSLAGVWAQLDYDVSPVRKVAASCFWPRPEIGSTVVRLVRHHRNDAVPYAVREAFHRMTKLAFEHRRKQLGAIFKTHGLPAEALSLPVARAGGKSAIELSSARPEELSNEEWLAFARAVSKLHLPNT